MTGRGKTILMPAAIVVLSLCLYAPGLRNEFTFDDFPEIVDNPLIRDLDWGALWQAYLPGPGKVRPPGRFFPLLTFSVNYAVAGTEPFGYHLVNILLNGGVCLLVYLVGLELFPGEYRLSFLTALLFASHPVHSEVVAAAVGRSELLSSFCFLSAVLLYWRNTRGERAGWSAGYWFSVPLLLIGILSKATAWTLPLVAAVFDAYRFRPAPGRPRREYLPVFVYRLKKFYLPYCLVPAVILGLTAGMLPAREEMGSNYLVVLPFGGRLAAALGILARYLCLLVWPFRLSADYGYSHLSAAPSWLRAALAAGGAAAIAGGGALAWASLKRKGRYFLAVFIFAVNYLIISNLFFLINVSMAERLIYMASWGFCLAAALALESGFRRFGRGGRACLLVLVSAVLLAYSLRVLTRNRDWRDNFTLFAAAHRVCPTSCRVNYNLGLEYSRRGMPDRAIFHYGEAVRVHPWNPLYRLNLGEAYARKGDMGKAVEQFEEVVRLEPEEPGGYINLAAACNRMGLADRAIGSLLIARRLVPDDWRVYSNLGDSFRLRRELARAERAYETSLRGHPDDWQAWNKLGAVKLGLEKPREAVACFRRAIDCFPECKEAYNNLGLLYALSGEAEEAARAYRKALAIDPGFEKAKNNLNRLLGR